MSKRVLLFVVALVILSISGYALLAYRRDPSRANKPFHELTYDDYRRAQGKPDRLGVHARHADPANSGTRWVESGWMMGSHPLAPEMARSPADLDELATSSPETWKNTQMWKLSHGGVTDFGLARQACMVEKLKGRLGDQPCQNDIVVVVERTGSTDGRVVFVRPELPEGSIDACREYSDCVSQRGWLGRPTPLPDEDVAYYAFRAGDVMLPFMGSEQEKLELLQKQTQALRTQIDDLEKAGASREHVALIKDMADFYEWVLAQAS